MSEDLYKEIDADIRMEKLHFFLQRYAKVAIIIIVVGLIVFGLVQFKQWQHRKTIINASTSYLQVLQQISMLPPDSKNNKDLDQIIEQLNQLSNHAPQSVRALAQLKQASLLVDQKKIEEASAIWESLRFDKTALPDFRNLANLLWIENHLDSANVKVLYNRIKELTNQKTPWYVLASECEAMLDLKTGKLIEAKQIFGRLSADVNASPEIRKRAGMMLQIIAVNKKGS